MISRIYSAIKYIFSFMLLAAPLMASAADRAADELKKIGSEMGPYQDLGSSGEYGLSQIIGVVVQGALALIGAIFLVLMLYAGYHWMTARGEEEKVEKAKDTIQRAIVGIIIVVGAYAIWAFIFSKLF